jgi:hypothetical protein
MNLRTATGHGICGTPTLFLSGLKTSFITRPWVMPLSLQLFVAFRLTWILYRLLQLSLSKSVLDNVPGPASRSFWTGMAFFQWSYALAGV